MSKDIFDLLKRGFQVYQVGGCVRDGLLGVGFCERDWVVVGATPQQMLACGFKQVGADFPVFLHPESGEEYALARTERKSGRGYKGFAVDFSAGITLEADLARRDLTINAMALDVEGQLIDPFGGRLDLQRRLLRHVSPAFAEDPLRVLRVARFGARLASIGFVVHPETLVFMGDLVRGQELAELTVERVWQETLKALATPTPAEYFRILDRCGALAVVFPELVALQGQTHSPVYHPEGDAYAHVLLVLEQVAALSNDPAIRFAALTHDLGKGVTPVAALPHHYSHDARGAEIVAALCRRMRVAKRTERLAVQVAGQHMRCHRVLEMRPGKILTLLEQLDALRQPEELERFLLACAADFYGQRSVDAYPAGKTLRACLYAALAVGSQPLIDAGFQGVRLGEALRQERIRQIKKTVTECRNRYSNDL